MFGILTENQSYFLKMMEASKIIRLCKICLLLVLFNVPVSLWCKDFQIAGLNPDISGLMEMKLLPKKIHLLGKNSTQQVLVLGTDKEGLVRDLTKISSYSIMHPELARVDLKGKITALAGGQTFVKAEFQGQTITAKIWVNNENLKLPFDFPIKVGRILTKRGCNSVECHGSVGGKGGFKLSKNASSPREDYRWITEGGTFHVLTTKTGKKIPRINIEQPAQSLLLLKPTTSVPHGGGERLQVESKDYQIMLDWIRTGAPYVKEPLKEVPVQVENLVAMPRQIVLKPGRTQQLLVVSYLSNGLQEDVSNQVRYLSNNEEIVSVTVNGLLTGHGVGETEVQVLAPGYTASVTVGVISKAVISYPNVARHNFIDHYIFDKARKFHLVPSTLSTDSEFLRRICLDLTGTLPPVSRVREFLDTPSSEKRTRLIKILLESPEFVDHWSWRFTDFLRAKNPIYKQWIHEAIGLNKPYDQLARERIAAQGFDGPSRHYEDMGGTAVPLPQNAMAEQVRVFLGQRLDCAQCHDHPYENWTQNQFWGLTAFFGRLSNLHPGFPQVDFVILDDPEGYGTFGKGAKVIHPRNKLEVQPQFLDGNMISGNQHDDLRLALAEWMTSPENPYFSKAIVNRIWSYFFGRGIVDPVDDFRSNNLPTHPQLLNRLAQYFIRTGYDLRSLIRLIVESRTYQLSGSANETNQHDQRNYSRALPRPLETELLLKAITHVTQVKGLNGNFFDVYQKPDLTSIPERDMSPSLNQALHQLAGSTYTTKLSQEESRMGRLLKENATDIAIIEELYLSALCRFPLKVEKVQLEKLLQAQDTRHKAVEDLVWAMINSEQFLNNH